LRLRWTDPALADLAELAERAPVQAAAVVRAVEWLAGLRTPAVGRYVPDLNALYWPVPPQGVAYLVEPGEIVIVGIYDARRRRQPW
jgi:hypothetical protein